MKYLIKLFIPALILALLLSACTPLPPQEGTDPTQSTASVPATEPEQTGPADTDSTEPSDTDPTEPEQTDPTEPSQTQPTQPEPTEPEETDPTEPEKTEPTGPSATEPDPGPLSDPYEGMTSEEFYADYTPATSYRDALYRSQHGFLSGSLQVPGQDAEPADYQPMQGDTFIRNIGCYYTDDGNGYVVVDGYGVEVMRIYRGGAYITLEEVAAYMYAFGGTDDGSVDLPANYTTNKSGKPQNGIWGEYLRLNHSRFSGDTSRYPYEPELPDISGCGGKLQYYEMDIGTTGTVTPGYSAYPYNNGYSITRGAARLVYARQDKNGNGVYEPDECYVFYTHNHYNDFREYLNYYGGWGEIFGNVTGGGSYSSKYDCNPTPYVPTLYQDFGWR